MVIQVVSKPLLSQFKTVFVNIPIKVPIAWRDDIQIKASRLGISRNAAFCLIVKFGGPMVEAHLLAMEKSLMESCLKITEGKVALKKGRAG